VRFVRWGWLLVLLLLAVAAIVLRLFLPDGEAPSPPTVPAGTVAPIPTRTPRPVPTIAPAEATALAAKAESSAGELRVGGASAGVVAAGGGFVGAVPSPAPVVEVARAGATPAAAAVQADELLGIAAIQVEPDEAAPSAGFELGSSQSLEQGQQVIVAPGTGDRTLIGLYVGRASVMLPGGLGMYVLDVQLPAGAQVRQGAVLDPAGRLVGIISPDRQSGAPPGRVYAVPIESAGDLLLRAGLITPTALPTPRPTRPSESDG
jgi:hypothetical protein